MGPPEDFTTEVTEARRRLGACGISDVFPPTADRVDDEITADSLTECRPTAVLDILDSLVFSVPPCPPWSIRLLTDIWDAHTSIPSRRVRCCDSPDWFVRHNVRPDFRGRRSTSEVFPFKRTPAGAVSVTIPWIQSTANVANSARRPTRVAINRIAPVIARCAVACLTHPKMRIARVDPETRSDPCGRQPKEGAGVWSLHTVPRLSASPATVCQSRDPPPVEFREFGNQGRIVGIGSIHPSVTGE